MTNAPYPVYSARFWKAYLIHMRPYLLFVSGAAGLAGIAAAPVEPLPPNLLFLGFLPLFLSYGFGQALTDCFQVDTDRLSAPYRPLSQGIVSTKAIGTVSLIGLVAGVGVLVFLNPWNAFAGALSILGLATYTFFKRRYWFAGPFYNAWIVALLPLIGYVSMDRTGLPEHLKDIVPVMALSFFTYTNFVLMGYLKDISADRATGYNTFPVVFGWNPTVWVGDLLVLLSAGWGAALTFSDGWSKVVWGLATVIAVAGQIYAHITSEKTEANASVSIAATVRSFILWHLAVILAFREDWWPGLIVFYLLFEWTLWKRPSQAQI
jgi:geranylgeranylglycerol-phosphate geranylgeranyltransferase